MPPFSSKTKKQRRRQDERLPASPEPLASDLPSNILTLQRSAGNRAVSGLLQRKSSTATLPVSEPGDTSERQADQVADEVIGSQATPGFEQGSHSASSMPSRASTGTLDDLGSGEPLDPATRSSFEPGFGADFSSVRIHSDGKAGKSARDLNARAYTVGSDVVFAEGEYQPHTSEGKRLLAHELAHVVQQGAGAGPVVVQRAVALTDDDFKALAAQLHDAIYQVGTDEESIFVALQKLEKDATAIKKLIEVYKKEHNGADLEADIRGDMSDDELILALELMGIKDDPKAADVVGTAPATDAEFKTVARKLLAAMDQAGTEEEEIYGQLMPFNRDDTKLTKLKTIYQSELSGGITGSGLEADIKSEMSSDELAYALFLLNAPQPETTPQSGATITKAGTKAHDVKVPGGEITVETGLEIQTPSGTTFADTYSVAYEGGQSKESRWLQFIWSEILATQADGSVKTVDETGLPTSNGTMDLTTDPSSPKYKVDAATSASPFYEKGGVDIRTATATTLLDRPFEFSNAIKRQFDAGATKVVERDHFEDFLVRDYKSIYHISLYVEWIYTSKTVSTRKTHFKSGGKVTAMDSAMREQLLKEYPKFEYIM